MSPNILNLIQPEYLRTLKMEVYEESFSRILSGIPDLVKTSCGVSSVFLIACDQHGYGRVICKSGLNRSETEDINGCIEIVLQLDEAHEIENAAHDLRFLDFCLTIDGYPLRYLSTTPIFNDENRLLAILVLADSRLLPPIEGRRKIAHTWAEQIAKLFELQTSKEELSACRDELQSLKEHFSKLSEESVHKKRAVEEIQEAHARANKAAQAKTEFLANMSHEIRTPMNAIIGMTELLKETPLNFDQERFVKIISNAGSSLLEVINNILDLSKIESGNFELDSIPFDLEDLVATVTEILYQSAYKKKIDLNSSISIKVSKHIVGDPARIREALVNLMNNAIKFTKQGEVNLRVELGPNNDELLFTVTDTGIGIPKQHANKLFKVFSQADNSVTREFGGSGLGLAITKKIIELMGGQIGFESEEGKGSTFYFSIPYREATSSVHSSEIVSLQGATVLLGDGNAAHRTAVAEMLHFAKANVLEVQSRDLAFESLLKAAGQKVFPNLVIFDLQFLGEQYAQFIFNLRKFLPLHVPIVLILSSNEEREKFPACMSLGISVYLVKPIRPSEFMRVVGRAIQNAKIRPQVLFVDDEKEICNYSFELLSSFPMDVVTVSDGAKALELLKKQPFHLLISDMRMPHMDGITLFQEARKLMLDIPFLICSGHLTKEQQKICNELGVVDYIEKPIAEDRFIKIVDRILERYLVYDFKKQIPKPVIAVQEQIEQAAKILVVDDVEENVFLIRQFLKTSNWEVHSVKNGKEAVDAFQAGKYDVILMDIQMPVMDGSEAIKLIRKLESENHLAHTQIISLSAHALNEEVQVALEAGADNYLTKPVKRVKVVETIKECLDKRH